MKTRHTAGDEKRIGLNDVCDALQLNSGPSPVIRGATPPSRNHLPHANPVRDAVMAEKPFWAVEEHLGNVPPEFVSGKAPKRLARVQARHSCGGLDDD